MAVQNSLQRSRGNQRLGISAYLTADAVKNQINQVVGGKDGQRFISAIVSAVNTNPALQECTNQSILSGALLGESLKLSPSPQLGQYYLVPFNDKNKGKVAQFQLGYKGYIQLAIRSGQYKKLNVLAIKEGELVYKGQKWDNMSGSERLMVSTAIVRKLNPECGFVLLDKLEQMDLQTLQEFGSWLEGEGLQAIATRVSTGDECSIIIEDGYVVGQAQAEQPQQKSWKAGVF